MTLRTRLLLILTATGILVLAFYIGAVFGYSRAEIAGGVPVSAMSYTNDYGVPPDADLASFWKVWHLIDEKYVSIEGPSSEERMYGATKGLVESLGDPYSVFFPPVEAEFFEDEVRGNFGGIGIEVGVRDEVLTVVAPLKGTPAERAGILAGDKVVEIGEVSSFNMSVDEAVRLIRGEVGTPVSLTLVRKDEEEPIRLTIVRETIQIPTIESVLRDDGVFVISLHNFSASSPDLFRGALREFVESGSDKLIIDVRNNPGGFLEAALDMASWFLPAGKPVVSERGADPADEYVYRSKGYDIFTDKLKLVILVNQGSASASEIFAGALSEYKKATLVGEKTFGKGSVQELIPITDTTSLKITVAKWFTPNGVSISEQGFAPDIKVSFTKKDYDVGRDPQMQKAVDFLLRGV